MSSAPDTAPNPDDERRLAVIRAVERFDPRKSEIWQELGALSPNIELQEHYADPEGIIISGNSFRGVMNLYVLLKYDGAESLETGEAFPAIFDGHFTDDGTAVIDKVRVKTESFFA
jgi:hypothetical protein